MRRLFDRYPSDRLWALTSTKSKRIIASFDPIPPPERQISVPEIQIHRRWIHKLAVAFELHADTVDSLARSAARAAKSRSKRFSQCRGTTSRSRLTSSTRSLAVQSTCTSWTTRLARRRFGGLQPLAYALLMPRIVRACKRVWGVSDGMCEYFEQTYGVKCLPLASLGRYRRVFGSDERETAGPGGRSFHIVYTGSIYGAQVDAMRRLVHVVDQASDRNGQHASDRCDLTLYTSSHGSGA